MAKLLEVQVSGVAENASNDQAAAQTLGVEFVPVNDARMQVRGVLVEISFTETDDAEPATDDGAEGFAGGTGHGAVKLRLGHIDTFASG